MNLAAQLIFEYRRLRSYGLSPKNARICAYMRACSSGDQLIACINRHKEYWRNR